MALSAADGRVRYAGAPRLEASARVMRDSIDASFVPFVKRDNSVQTSGITRFRNSVAGELTPAESGELVSILAGGIRTRRGVVGPI